MVFEYPGNFSNGTEVVDLGTFAQYANYVSDSTLGFAFLTVIFFVTLAGALVSGVGKAIMVSSFVTLIFSMFFVRLDMIPAFFPIILMVILAASSVMSFNEGRM